jgi:hypothetical protein
MFIAFQPLQIGHRDELLWPTSFQSSSTLLLLHRFGAVVQLNLIPSPRYFSIFSSSDDVISI